MTWRAMSVTTLNSGILQSSLPDTIWVRVYEDRMDLLRAVMIGPEGTPYHDNLFVFDFHFGAQYPAEPPMVGPGHIARPCTPTGIPG
jgi:ubiquitin-protein ligase